MIQPAISDISVIHLQIPAYQQKAKKTDDTRKVREQGRHVCTRRAWWIACILLAAALAAVS